MKVSKAENTIRNLLDGVSSVGSEVVDGSCVVVSKLVWVGCSCCCDVSVGSPLLLSVVGDWSIVLDGGKGSGVSEDEEVSST